MLKSHISVWVDTTKTVGINYISENLRVKVSSSFDFFVVVKFELDLKSLPGKKISTLTFLGKAKYKHYHMFRLL